MLPRHEDRVFLWGMQCFFNPIEKKNYVKTPHLSGASFPLTVILVFRGKIPRMYKRANERHGERMGGEREVE